MNKNDNMLVAALVKALGMPVRELSGRVAEVRLPKYRTIYRILEEYPIDEKSESEIAKLKEE